VSPRIGPGRLAVLIPGHCGTPGAPLLRATVEAERNAAIQTVESIELHAGQLSFSALACGSGPVVLCLHGFPDHAGSFRFQLPALADGGYRAIAPTLRGYEPSSQPSDGDYHLVRMAEDVIAWLDQLGEERVHLVGHDWGAVIGYVVGAMAPERLRSLTTLAIPHPGRLREGLRAHPIQLRNSWYMLFFQLRGLADFAVSWRNWALIEKLWRDWSPGWQLPPAEMAAVKQTLAQPGVRRAALGYYRAMFGLPSEAAKQTQRLLEAPIRVPTLALTGARDGCMDSRIHDVAMREEDFPAGFELVRLQNSGHFLHQEEPDEFNRLLLDWLRRVEQPEP
jgi:pimeloyl-ACP methyl ester carboxylesterase